MRSNRIVRAYFYFGIAGLLFLAMVLSAQQHEASPAHGSVKVSVFFNTNKVMEIDELRTNAISVLRAKGHVVPQSAECVVNVVVQGKRPGCSVMFFDLKNNWQYLVSFDGQGKVLEVNGGARRHGTVGPNSPRPKVPDGGIIVRPQPN